MFKDVKMSRELQVTFKDYIAQSRVSLPVDIIVQVLTTGSWPHHTNSSAPLPPELQQCCQKFEDFYVRRHNGRKLTWQPNMGTAEIRAMFDCGKKELTVSTY